MTFQKTLRTLAFTLLTGIFCTTATWAQSTDMSSGEVRKIDKGAGKITLKHGEIKNLDMPPMTMVFQVRDPALLDKAKPGDKVRFTAEQKDGAIIITTIEPAL